MGPIPDRAFRAAARPPDSRAWRTWAPPLMLFAAARAGFSAAHDARRRWAADPDRAACAAPSSPARERRRVLPSPRAEARHRPVPASTDQKSNYKTPSLTVSLFEWVDLALLYTGSTRTAAAIVLRSRLTAISLAGSDYRPRGMPGLGAPAETLWSAGAPACVPAVPSCFDFEPTPVSGSCTCHARPAPSMHTPNANSMN